MFEKLALLRLSIIAQPQQPQDFSHSPRPPSCLSINDNGRDHDRLVGIDMVLLPERAAS